MQIVLENMSMAKLESGKLIRLIVIIGVSCKSVVRTGYGGIRDEGRKTVSL